MTVSKPQRSVLLRVFSLVAVGFGALTLKEGGGVLFGDVAARAAAGNYVPFVLWANFCAGFFYIAAGIGLWLHRVWAMWLALAILLATLLTYAAFGMHIATGGAFEMRTVIAMGIRSGVWLLIGAAAYRLLRRH